VWQISTPQDTQNTAASPFVTILHAMSRTKQLAGSTKPTCSGIGLIVREKRVMARLSLTACAKRVGVSKAYLCGLETVSER
jgi:hypothetical protein